MSKKRFHIIRRLWKRLLKVLRLSPLSLAVKCQLMFGSAVVLTLALALILPYIWMRQLVKKDYLDTERVRTETILYRQHFNSQNITQISPIPLNNAGLALDPNNMQVQWIRLNQEDTDSLIEQLPETQRENVQMLIDEEGMNDIIDFEKISGVQFSIYTRIFRATDNCISCHNQQGLASAFSPSELIGVGISRHVADEMAKTNFLNSFWVSTAGLIAGIGAIISFYWITQRVILRPIRQLRALVNNVADGNLEIRSSIRTGDEYENLANAFNKMLDGLIVAQEKLRNANKQLDTKIAELSERNIELIKANKLKNEFLANISHEFRTPLNAILGFAQVLNDKADQLQLDKAKRYSENIITSGNNLLGMINDLLDLAKTQAGKLELHIGQISVEDMLKNVVSQFSLLTKDKKIKVKLIVDPNLPPLTSDIGRVQQILYNFLSNAVKFTSEKGKVEIRAVLLEDDITLRISVADTGCGIAEENKEKIFEKFSTADGSLTRKSEGSGLGLAISGELAVMLAGSIGVESQLDEGSTFWLDIPITLKKDQPAQNTQDA
ncbi:ATP-binding protein [Planctomycetota bacterium]